jgi:hypothetical protein
MPKGKRSRLYPAKRRFGGVPGGRAGRRALAKSFSRAFRRTGGGWSPRTIRRVLSAAGVRYKKGRFN